LSTLTEIPRPPRKAEREHPLFSEEHHALRQSIRTFVENELLPQSSLWEIDFYPNDAVRRMGELGLLGLDKPVEYGGQGGDYASSVILFEELSRALSGGFLMAMSVQTDMALPPILAFGTEEQKQKWAVQAIRGEIVLALAMTEVHAGSDLRNTSLRAVKDGDEWVLTGSKMYITNGYRADLIVLLAKSDPDAGHGGFTTFLVPGDAEGLHRGKPLQKLGMHASDTAELIFDGVRLGADAVLGEVGRGFQQIMWELQGERLTTAVMALAMAERGYEATVEFVRQRETFGAPLASRQAVNHRLAECAIKLQVAREAIYSAAWHVQHGRYPVVEITGAKLYAARMACEVLDECIQFHGAAGYMREYRIEQLWRDARLFRIGAGSDEVQLEIIAKTVEGS
jgi:alkylation response protein AidB-like acyl-CoA dehydrogenase